MKYRKKPVIIDAYQWTGVALNHWPDWLKEAFKQNKFFTYPQPTVSTLEGDMHVRETDWIIKGVADELYPCRNDIFLATYEPVPESESKSGQLQQTAQARIEKYQTRKIIPARSS